MAAPLSLDEFRRLAPKLAADPVLFCDLCLGFQPWERQAEIMRAVAAHDRCACRSGQKIGKTRIGASLAIWWAVTRPNANVILTAPTFDQVKDPIWKEVRWLADNARVRLSGEAPGLDPATGWRIGRNSIIKGRTTDKPTRMQGLSGAQSFYIVDEASGYAEPLFDAIKGNLAGGGKLLMISNPNELSGTFYDAFHTKQHLWKTLHIRSTDTPNFHGGNIPGLATPAWLAEQLEDWGEGSEAYQVRALGEFPSSSSDAVISLTLVEGAKTKRKEAAEAFASAKDLLHFGVDVGRGGDDTVIVPRRGYALGTIAAFNGVESEDGPAVAQRVMIGVRALRRDGEKPFVKVDMIGYGASAYDALKPFASGRNAEIELYGVNSGQRSDDELRFHNLRAQLHFGLRDWLKDGGQLPDDGKLGGEIIAAKWKNDERGRVKVELKENIKKRLGRSPDRCDALCMAVYDRQIGYTGPLPGIIPMSGTMVEA